MLNEDDLQVSLPKGTGTSVKIAVLAQGMGFNTLLKFTFLSMNENVSNLLEPMVYVGNADDCQHETVETSEE